MGEHGTSISISVSVSVPGLATLTRRPSLLFLTHSKNTSAD